MVKIGDGGVFQDCNCPLPVGSGRGQLGVGFLAALSRERPVTNVINWMRESCFGGGR